jgi:hypothetical protein
MTRPDNNPDDLERLIDRTLRALPPRQAPRTLESRVLAELERRAALPWWRKQFAYWPRTARLAFMLASFGAAVAVTWLLANTKALHLTTSPPAWIRSLSHATSSMSHVFSSVVGLIPPAWLYSALALCALLYGSLLGLGAVGYHILYVDPRSRGLQQT